MTEPLELTVGTTLLGERLFVQSHGHQGRHARREHEADVQGAEHPRTIERSGVVGEQLGGHRGQRKVVDDHHA